MGYGSFGCEGLVLLLSRDGTRVQGGAGGAKGRNELHLESISQLFRSPIKGHIVKPKHTKSDHQSFLNILTWYSTSKE